MNRELLSKLLAIAILAIIALLFIISIISNTYAMNITIPQSSCFNITNATFSCEILMNFTCNVPEQNITQNITYVWFGSNQTTEDRYFLCKDSLVECESQRDIIVNRYDECKTDIADLDSIKNNATDYQQKYSTVSMQLMSERNRLENEKNQYAIIAAVCGFGGAYMLFKKKEPSETKDITDLPRVG